MLLHTNACLTIIFMLHSALAQSVLVEVEQGTLAGEELKSVLNNGSYYSFKGIPYAKPPIGSLRFMPPQPPVPWDGVRNATEHGEICPQLNGITNVYSPGSEDCLFLNVYTPNMKPDKPLPVMFFIHGGGFRFGSGNSDTLGPDYLVIKKVVLVTFNYRLGALGFLSLDNEQVPGNMGLKDQVAALKWVKNNIRKFGGDPDMITIFGQSAGSASVMYHMLSPMSEGYFQRAISMSGSLYSDWAIPFEPARRAFILGQTLGYDTRNKTELFNFLQNAPVDKLVTANATVLAAESIINNILKLQTFVPVREQAYGQEEVFLPGDAAALIKEGKVNKVDFMTGYCNIETVTALTAIEQIFTNLYRSHSELLVPASILIKSDSNTNLRISDKIRQYYFGDRNIDQFTVKEIVYHTSNSSFIIDVHRFLRNLPNAGNNSRYFYKFSSYTDLNVNGKAGGKYELYGAAHYDDLMYLFSTETFNITVERNSIEYDLIDKVTTLFTNFAKYGNPTPDSSLGFVWPLFDSETVPYMSIGNTLSVFYKPDEEYVQFWKGVYADAKIDF